MKKLVSKVIILFFLCLCLINTGFGGKKNIAQISLLFDGKEVFCEVMEIDLFKYLEIKIFYRGNFRKHYQNSESGTPIDYIGSLDKVFARKTMELISQYDCEAAEPNASYQGQGVFTYQEGKEGLKCDIDSLADTIIDSFSSNMAIGIPYSVIKPTEEMQDIIERTKKLSSFTTNYRTSSENRKKKYIVSGTKIKQLSNIVRQHTKL